MHRKTTLFLTVGLLFPKQNTYLYVLVVYQAEIPMKKIIPILMLMLLSMSVFAHSPGIPVDELGQPFLKEFSVYPNPTTGAMTLTLEAIDENRPLQLKVYSLIGQEMYAETLMPFSGIKKHNLDLTKFAKGIYMLEISNGDKSRIKRVSVI